MATRAHLSRRRFFLLAGSSLLAVDAAFGQAEPLTAKQVIERIQKEVGVPWSNQTVDTFKMGSPDTPVKGIATTVMATFDVCQRANAAGKNLIITHEPTFYNHQDETKHLANSSVFLAKKGFIEKNGMVIWRFHDYIHRKRPDGIMTGMVEALGWNQYRMPDGPRLFVLPAMTLEAMAKDIQTKLKIRTMRVIGDPKMQASKVALGPGYNDGPGVIRTLERPDIEVLVIGESREWEGVEFAQDSITAGNKKGLIILGHAVSEESGMKECARWLKTFITEVPIEFVPAGEPFWTPK